MKLTALTALTIANAFVLIAGLVLSHLGLLDSTFNIPPSGYGALAAFVLLGAAVDLDRRNREAADREEFYPADCA
ncbi:hypothetical protein ASG87_01475 [Frateuria sp. Soil773]|uniref:hypothetical protein n=1 Tax=Frateuria sp. Soil773 TaxID=1736407 RepID=UPI0006FC43E1|nr:hypothetical protein [Frateuria sp. Soil773]KRE90834.1 hypothetical protein ASG87_01475 [Frateuria sp. Soil773]